MRGRTLAVLIALLIGACASEPRVLHLGMEDAPEGKRLLWPQPPEVPRYMYAGQLTGENNFRQTGEQTRGALKSLLYWIVGLVAGDSRPTVLQRPQAGLVDAMGRILVTDMSRQAVFVFDAAAGRLDVWESAVGVRRFVAPVGIAQGAADTTLVADAELGLVARLDRAGRTLGTIGEGQLRRPTGLASDQRGERIYVADTAAHDIKVFANDGRLVGVLGRRGEEPGEFNFPTHLALAGDELYVTDSLNNRVQVFDTATGAVRRVFGERGLHVGNLVRPKGVAVDGERNVYVVESYYDHLLVFDRRGRFLMGIGGVGQDTGKFYLPAGVWTDHSNRVFIADMFNGRVMVFQYLGEGTDADS